MHEPIKTAAAVPDDSQQSLEAARARRRARGRGGSPATHERHLEAWRERRDSVLGLAERDAHLRIEMLGAMAATRDAARAIADPGAATWRARCEELLEAARAGRKSAVSHLAARGAREAAGDAARGGALAPDPDLAVAATTAFLVVGLRPRCLLVLASQTRHRARRAHPADDGRTRAQAARVGASRAER
jgi:hypothetical protein